MLQSRFLDYTSGSITLDIFGIANPRCKSSEKPLLAFSVLFGEVALLVKIVASELSTLFASALDFRIHSGMYKPDLIAQ